LKGGVKEEASARLPLGRGEGEAFGSNTAKKAVLLKRKDQTSSKSIASFPRGRGAKGASP